MPATVTAPSCLVERPAGAPVLPCDIRLLSPALGSRATPGCFFASSHYASNSCYLMQFTKAVIRTGKSSGQSPRDGGRHGLRLPWCWSPGLSDVSAGGSEGRRQSAPHAYHMRPSAMWHSWASKSHPREAAAIPLRPRPVTRNLVWANSVSVRRISHLGRRMALFPRVLDCSRLGGAGLPERPAGVPRFC